jgi:hypothetical protein
MTCKARQLAILRKQFCMNRRIPAAGDLGSAQDNSDDDTLRWDTRGKWNGLTECFTSNKEVGALFLRATLIAAPIAAAAIATATIGLASPANAETECPPGYYPAASDCVPAQNRAHHHARSRPQYAEMVTGRAVNTPTAAAHATAMAAFKRT